MELKTIKNDNEVQTIKGKIKITGDIFQYSNYDLGVKIGGSRYDFKDTQGKYWKHIQINGSAFWEEVIIGRQKEKKINNMEKGAFYTYLNNKSINIKRNITQLKDIYLCNVLKYVDMNGDVIPPKMLTVTFKNDVKDLATAEGLMRKMLKRLNYLIKTTIDDKFKLCAIGIREHHKKTRIGYHFHFICFNLPKINFEEFSSFGVKESQKFGRVEIAVLKQFKNRIIDVSYDGGKEKINLSNDPIDYISKTISYMSKELEDLYKIGYENNPQDDKKLMQSLESELNKSVVYKTGNLIKPLVKNLFSDEEFQAELDQAFTVYSFQKKVEFTTEFLGWVDVFKFFDCREKSDFLENVMDYMGFDFQYIGDDESLPTVVNYDKNKFFIDYENERLMYVDNKNFDVINEKKYSYIIKKVPGLSGEFIDFINKKQEV